MAQDAGDSTLTRYRYEAMTDLITIAASHGYVLRQNGSLYQFVITESVDQGPPVDRPITEWMNYDDAFEIVMASCES